MRSSKELIGKAIISMSDGRNLGIVKDVYLDPDLRGLSGIYLGAEGIFSRKARLIAGENVAVHGFDAILVKNADVVLDTESFTAADDWVRLDKLRGRHIDTPGGTRVGILGDVYLDEEGRVVSFGLARSFIEGPIAARGIISRDVVIDTGDAERAMTIDLARAEMESAPPTPAEPDVTVEPELETDEEPEVYVESEEFPGRETHRDE
jgi:uncharacterized protein YrrD